MADATRTRTRPNDSVNADQASDDDEDDEPTPAPRRGAAPTVDAALDDDDASFDDSDSDDDDAIIIGEGWDTADEPSDVFPTVERGVYVIMLADAEVKRASEKAKNPGMKYGNATFKIRAEDNAETMGDEAPTVTVWKPFFFTQASYGRTKKDLARMGIQLAPGQDAMAALYDLADAQDGALFEAVIKKTRYRAEDDETGKMVTKFRNEIARILRPLD